MDVIQPQLVWIGQCCYRKNPISSQFGGTIDADFSNLSPNQNKPSKQLSGTYEADDCYDEDMCSAEETYVQAEKMQDGRFRTSMSVPSEYFAKIIGRSGETKKQIEKDTKTVIAIPKKGQPGDIIITGLTQKGVSSAFVRISMLVSLARKKMPFTHFISIPLTSPGIKSRYLQFKKEALNMANVKIEPALFQNPDKLHITICTLVLLNKTDREKASKALQAFQEQIPGIIGHEPLEIGIRGVEYMNDDPGQVDVLYGRIVDVSGRLQKLADGVVKCLEEDGLVDRQYEHVKLHATLMNSLFAIKEEEEGNRETFNAKPILKEFENYEFGAHLIESLHLSERYSTSPSTKYYMSTSQIKLFN